MVIAIYFLSIANYAVFAADSTNSATNCGLDKGMSFEGWEHWRQITDKPIASKGHNNNWVGIFVDRLARDTYLSAGSRYPVCARIVKPVYTNKAGAVVRRITVMVKLPPGYDPENGNWWYGVFDKTGTTAIKQGRLVEDCIACHEQAAERDYLFSAEVLGSIKQK